MLKQALPGPGRRITGSLLMLSLLASASYAAWAAQPATVVAADSQQPSFVTRLYGDDDVSPPAYPADALAQQQSGKVVLDILVGTDGHIKDVKIVSAQPAGIFEQASIAAARKWKLHPAIEGGHPVERWMRMPVQFIPPPAPVASSN